MDSNLQAVRKRRSLNMVNDNMNQTYHKNLQRTYTDEVEIYQKRMDESIPIWNKHITDANELVENKKQNVDVMIIDADLNILNEEQKAVIDAADKINAKIMNKAIEAVRKRYDDVINGLQCLKKYEATTLESMENGSCNITSLFE